MLDENNLINLSIPITCLLNNVWMLQDVARISSQYSEHFSMWRIIYISEPYFLFPFHMFFYLAFMFFITFLFIYICGKPIYFVFVLFVVICVLYFSYLFLFFSFQVGFIIYILLLFTHFSMWSHSSDLLSCLFKKKMTYETLRDSNEIGLFNFVESLCTLSIGIQNMNAWLLQRC